MRRTRYAFCSLACVLAVGSAASAGSTPGITSTSILIGGTTPLSGVASAYASIARGADAYFKYVNARGGVNGRKIKYVYRDDAYDPSQTVQQTRQLVQDDKVFAIFNSLGTEQNLAVRKYLNTLEVPQLFVASGATTWGRDYKKYPWTIGYQPSYQAEGAIYGHYVTKTKPHARIGVLYQNDDYGNDLLTGLKRGLGSKSRLIVAKQSYDVTEQDVQSQMAKLKASKVNTLMVFATPKYAIQSYVIAHKLGWQPQFIVNGVSSASNVMTLATVSTSKRVTEGSISFVIWKDPSDPKWANDSGFRLYKQIMRKYYAGGDVNDAYNLYAMAVAFTLVDTLKHAGKNVTRPGVMKAATKLNERNNPFLLPGIVVRTTAADHFPIDQARLERYHNGRWLTFGRLVSLR
jgi:branched-chain amino acid transport system substrate-binding protein